MALIRTILAILITLGLALAPVAGTAAANLHAKTAKMAMHDCPSHAKINVAKDHSCCDPKGLMAKCAAAVCALKCFKVAVVLAGPPVSLAKVRIPMPPGKSYRRSSFGWPPPTPPPQV